MPDMTPHDDNIRALFERSDTPSPRDDLRARILAEAAPAEAAPANDPLPANDNARRHWPALGAVAATLLAAVFAATTLTGGSDEAEDWASYADASGFAELYAWVEGE